MDLRPTESYSSLDNYSSRYENQDSYRRPKMSVRDQRWELRRKEYLRRYDTPDDSPRDERYTRRKSYQNDDDYYEEPSYRSSIYDKQSERKYVSRRYHLMTQSWDR